MIEILTVKEYCKREQITDTAVRKRKRQGSIDTIEHQGITHILIEKTMTETYMLRGNRCLWAKINLDIKDELVNVMISSDYGSYNYLWTHCGMPPKKFLTTLDMHYAMKKLMGGTNNLYEPDFEEREVSFKRAIIEVRLEGHTITKEEARDAWDEMKEIFDYCQTSEDIYFQKCMDSSAIGKVFYDFDAIPVDSKLKNQVKDFWKDLWTPFVEELKREIANT